jgi:hypothetical protein
MYQSPHILKQQLMKYNVCYSLTLPQLIIVSETH